MEDYSKLKTETLEELIELLGDWEHHTIQVQLIKDELEKRKCVGGFEKVWIADVATEKDMLKAVEEENYEEAAKIRDSIKNGIIYTINSKEIKLNKNK